MPKIGSLLLLLLLGALHPVNYEPLNDIHFDNTLILVSDDVEVYTPNETTYTEKFITYELKIIDSYIRRFAESNNLPTEKCIDSDLKVFIVDESILNDKERYPVTTNYVTTRWAMYDPYPLDDNLSAIILSDRSETLIDQILFGHEMSHYWYDTRCWDAYVDDTESLALEFQDFYTVERFGRRIR